MDVSVLASLALPDETPSEDHAARIAEDKVVIPALARIEFANLLVVNERRSRLTSPEVDDALKWLSDIEPVFDDSSDTRDLVRLCRLYRLTAYDAAYLELALRRGIPLLTRDTALLAAARAEGIAA